MTVGETLPSYECPPERGTTRVLCISPQRTAIWTSAVLRANMRRPGDLEILVLRGLDAAEKFGSEGWSIRAPVTAKQVRSTLHLREAVNLVNGHVLYASTQTTKCDTQRMNAEWSHTFESEKHHARTIQKIMIEYGFKAFSLDPMILRRGHGYVMSLTTHNTNYQAGNPSSCIAAIHWWLFSKFYNFLTHAVCQLCTHLFSPDGPFLVNAKPRSEVAAAVVFNESSQPCDAPGNWVQSRGLVWDTAGAGVISGVAVLVATGTTGKLWPVAVELIVPVHGKCRVGIS